MISDLWRLTWCVSERLYQDSGESKVDPVTAQSWRQTRKDTSQRFQAKLPKIHHVKMMVCLIWNNKESSIYIYIYQSSSNIKWKKSIIEIYQTRLQNKGGYFQTPVVFPWDFTGFPDRQVNQVTSWWPQRSVQARDSSANKCRPPEALKLRENPGKSLGKQGLKHKLKPRFVFFNAEIGVKAVDVPIQFYEY